MVSEDVVIVSGSYGAGHDAAADALARQLSSAGHDVCLLDIAAELPTRIGPLLRWIYFEVGPLADHWLHAPTDHAA
jgi:UDP-N-acetylglucosamine:LPS N-acetylglucosamine transferase